MLWENEGSRSPFVCERLLPCGQLWIVPFPLLFSEILSRGGGYNRGVLGSKIRRDQNARLNVRAVNWRAWTKEGETERGEVELEEGRSENLNGDTVVRMCVSRITRSLLHLCGAASHFLPHRYCRIQ